MLDRAYQPGASFSTADVALVAPIVAAPLPVVPASDETLRQSLGSLAAALPSQDAGTEGNRLKLKVYMTMLAGCDERALAYACRRCLKELDWMPTIHQLEERLAAYISPEAVAVTRAKAVLRAPRLPDASEGDQPATITADDIRAMAPSLRRVGIIVGAITEGDVEIALVEAESK